MQSLQNAIAIALMSEIIFRALGFLLEPECTWVEQPKENRSTQRS